MNETSQKVLWITYLSGLVGSVALLTTLGAKIPHLAIVYSALALTLSVNAVCDIDPTGMTRNVWRCLVTAPVIFLLVILSFLIQQHGVGGLADYLMMSCAGWAGATFIYKRTIEPLSRNYLPRF